MGELEKMLDECDRNNILVRELPLSSSDGRISGNRIAINNKLSTSAEKTCVLAEELGHYYTTVGNILDQNKENNRKQELHARIHAYERLIGLSGLIRTYENRCKNKSEMADELNVTEEFLEDAISYYRKKYGVCTSYHDYLIYFDPALVIFKKN